jgi:hypothetical protein
MAIKNELGVQARCGQKESKLFNEQMCITFWTRSTVNAGAFHLVGFGFLHKLAQVR